MLSFGWWRDKDNREGAKSIVDILKVVVPAVVIAGGAIWGVVYATADKPTPAPGPTISGNTVNTGDGANVNIGGTQEVTKP
ncbi:MAG: hypothetical protein AB8B85_11515 [Paracoccaceae bacterium]